MVILADFRRLVIDTRKTQAAAFVTGTLQNLIAQWVKYLIFVTTFGILGFPAMEMTLSWYAQYLSYTFKSHASIVNYLSGVMTLHLLLDIDISGFSGFMLKITLHGLRRQVNFEPKQALAIDPVTLLHIHQTLNFANTDDVVFWAICLTMFFLLLRKSNVVSDTLTDFDVNKLLCRSDLKWGIDDVQVTLKWSKTNQFGQHLVFSLPQIPGSCLCPMTALYHMCVLVPKSPSGLCFVREDGRPYTYYRFQSRLRRALQDKGYESLLYSSHSFHRGGTTFAFLCGVPTDLIKLLGSWKSDVYFKYLEFPMEARAAATQLMKHRIQVLNW